MAYNDIEMRDAAEQPAGYSNASSQQRYRHAAPQQIRAAMHVDQTRTASIFIVADNNIYLHSLPLLERFRDHLGLGCGAVTDLGSVGLQCIVITPQVVWRELDGLKGRGDRQAAVHTAIRLVNVDAQSERPFSIHQTLQLLEQAQQQQSNHTDVLVLLTDDDNLRGRAHAAGILAHRSESLSPRDATALYHQLHLPRDTVPSLLHAQAAGTRPYGAQSALRPAVQPSPMRQQQVHHLQQCSNAQQQPPQSVLQHAQQQSSSQHWQCQSQQIQQCLHPDRDLYVQQQQQRRHMLKAAQQAQVLLLQQHRPDQLTLLRMPMQQHEAVYNPQLQPQHSAGSGRRPSLSACSPSKPAASPSTAASPCNADSPGSTAWHGAATDALRILLDSLQPAVGAIFAHTLGADIWQDCMDPRPPWRSTRDMLMALLNARDSLGMKHADSGDFFHARDELWACANELRQNRGKDEVSAFVRRVLTACRQMLSIARRCLASHAAAPEWPASVDAEHLMEQLQADDEHLRGLAKCVPLH